MAREDLHFRLRIPEDLKNQIAEAAEKNHRSMTAEIVARLEKSFSPKQLPPFDSLSDEKKQHFISHREEIGRKITEGLFAMINEAILNTNFDPKEDMRGNEQTEPDDDPNKKPGA